MVNELGLYEIYGLSHVPFWQKAWFFWVLIGFVVVLCMIASAMFVRWYSGSKKQQALPYWQEALEQLDRLKKDGIATVAKGSLFYVRLTHILKEYLYNRYQFEIRGRTDTEAVAVLVRAQFDPQLLTTIQRIFEGGEYIKFANVSAAQHQIERDLHGSIAFIQATYPRPDNV